MNDERDKEEDRDGKVRGKGRKAGCDQQKRMIRWKMRKTKGRERSIDGISKEEMEEIEKEKNILYKFVQNIKRSQEDERGKGKEEEEEKRKRKMVYDIRGRLKRKRR